MGGIVAGETWGTTHALRTTSGALFDLIGWEPVGWLSVGAGEAGEPEPYRLGIGRGVRGLYSPPTTHPSGGDPAYPDGRSDLTVVVEGRVTEEWGAYPVVRYEMSLVRDSARLVVVPPTIIPMRSVVLIP